MPLSHIFNLGEVSRIKPIEVCKEAAVTHLCMASEAGAAGESRQATGSVRLAGGSDQTTMSVESRVASFLYTCSTVVVAYHSAISAPVIDVVTSRDVQPIREHHSVRSRI